PVGPATAGTIKLVTITGGDDGIPPDLLLQSETHISSKTNARFETAKPNKADFVVEEGKKVNLATPVSVESESKMEVQTTESVAETVTPVQKVNRSVEVNIKRPSWLPEDWKFEKKVRTNGASAGAVDNVFQKQSLHFSGCRDKIELDGSSVVKGVLKPWSEAQTVLSASPHLMCALVSSSRF
ncbi:hypothetical protein FXO38_36250, partial [Capsicum annuum]